MPKTPPNLLPPVAAVAVDDTPLLLRLPSELLPGIVEASASPLRTYIQLLSLCRVTRTATRGTPRELSFFCDDDADPLIDEVMVPTPDALAALVGPCKTLAKLTLPCGDVLPLWRRGKEAACAPWVSEAFSGHGQLTVLTAPSASAARVFMATLPGIVGHLPGLEQLHLGGPDKSTVTTRHIPLGPEDSVFWADSLRKSFRSLMAALGRSCPRLRVLHHTMPCDDVPPNALLPIAGVITDLHAPMGGNSGVSSKSFIAACLTSMRHLTLGWCSRHFLRPIASRLTQLRLLGSDLSKRRWRHEISESLADVGLCRLETLQLPLRCGPSAGATFARLIGANRKTLRTVILSVICDTPGTEAALWMLLDPLNGLPHLTDLTVILDGDGLTAPSHDEVVFACLTPGLLDRLEHLAIHLQHPWKAHCPMMIPLVRIASRRLRTLCLDVHNLPLQETTVELTCPRLEELALPEHGGFDPCLGKLVLDCPQLRSIEGFPGRSWFSGADAPCQHQATPMPHLVRVHKVRSGCSLATPLLSQLLDTAPRLRDLSGPSPGLHEGALLTRLLASGSLVRLSLSFSASLLPRHHAPQAADGRTLRLPAQLERLEVPCFFGIDGMELVVDAPGLRSLSLTAASSLTRTRVALRCPALGALKLGAARLVSLGLADPRGPVPPLIHLTLAIQLWGVPPVGEVKDESFMEDAAGPVELLGSRLRRICLKGTFPAWPQLAAALGRLPRLAELRLEDITSPGDLVLACPALKRLVLDVTRFRSVVFDCPLLEVLTVTRDSLELLEPAGGRVPPNLHLPTDFLYSDRSLRARFPWLKWVPPAERPW
ncbi:hypothetical protein PAPYR_6980 [Paratrimastix pyriformis]|uniref:F-box domain-containing protein n=1 Tax=Paratrimastix pyriformis TaxID=342808 RepID=A0ABQ8UJP8_9EUKA|nr:hypothetical protein PAPYR_6980 [Paratrimastix pyriformis]